MTNSRDYLLAIDPGLLTGVMYIDMSDKNDPSKVWSEEWSVDHFHDTIEGFLSENKDVCRVVIENFIIGNSTGKKSQQPWSLRLIGVVAFLCHKYEIPLTIQSPSERKFATSEKLKKVGFWHVAGEGHANDAGRHALVWVIDHYPQVAKLLVK